jgi:hypothetical protein
VRRAVFALSCAPIVFATSAFADSVPPVRSETGDSSAAIDIAPEPPDPAKRSERTRGDEDPTAQPSLGEAPPPPLRSRRKGLVLESMLGILGFAGQFRHVAPPAFSIRAVLGYEVFPWLMLLGQSELAFTDTSESQGPSQSRAFPIWGFGGGVRAGLKTGSLGGFIEADAGALTAQVPHDFLAYLGFRGAESLGLAVGGRVGAEWYQRDRHLALCAEGGPRVAQGFSKSGGGADLPLMWDAAAGLRYTF